MEGLLKKKYSEVATVALMEPVKEMCELWRHKEGEMELEE